MIALIHAVFPAIAPIEDSFSRLWPGMTRFNIIDDGLPGALQREGGITPAISDRIMRLAEHAQACGAQALLFTCSAFGVAIEAAANALPIPVLKPNESMFIDALSRGTRLGMIATFEPSIPSMRREFEILAATGAVQATLDTVLVPGALQAANDGNRDRHDDLVANAVHQLSHCDAIMLAQFSTSTASPKAQLKTQVPILTAPDAAVLRLRSVMQG